MLVNGVLRGYWLGKGELGDVKTDKRSLWPAHRDALGRRCSE